MPHNTDIATKLGTLRLDDIERMVCVEGLRKACGIMHQAASLLGITRYSLRRRISKHGILPSEYLQSRE